MEEDNQILSLTYNQSQDCFALGTFDGFRIFHCHPYKDTFKKRKYTTTNIT